MKATGTFAVLALLLAVGCQSTTRSKSVFEVETTYGELAREVCLKDVDPTISSDAQVRFSLEFFDSTTCLGDGWLTADLKLPTGGLTISGSFQAQTDGEKDIDIQISSFFLCRDLRVRRVGKAELVCGEMKLKKK
jgi:hypothetical protein